jgi:hypothetical protein
MNELDANHGNFIYSATEGMYFTWKGEERSGVRISGDIHLLEEVRVQYNGPDSRYVFCFAYILTFYFIDFLRAIYTYFPYIDQDL